MPQPPPNETAEEKAARKAAKEERTRAYKARWGERRPRGPAFTPPTEEAKAKRLARTKLWVERHYASAARNCLDLLDKIAVTANLNDAEYRALAGCMKEVIKTMILEKDMGKPFLDRALAKALQLAATRVKSRAS